MPVDPYGKLFDRADRYAMPINRKPRLQRLSRRSHFLLNGCLGLIALSLVFIFVVGIYSCSTRQPGQTDVRTDWPAILTAQGTGTEGTAPVQVSNVWQIEWHCNAPLVVQAVYAVTAVYTVINTNCNISQEAGAVEMATPGTVHLRILSQGSWTVNIREPA